MEKDLSPDQILAKASGVYEKKARQNIRKTLVLSFIAGIFIALGAVASTLASTKLDAIFRGHSSHAPDRPEKGKMQI